MSAQLQLRRTQNTQPWGFRLKGGVDQGIPLHAEHVGPNGRAGHAGLRPGDMILSICGNDAQNMTHMQVKQEILRAGNELDLVVQRGEFTAAQPPPGGPGPKEEARVQIVEEPTVKMGGPTFKDVRSKTFQHLDNELPQSEVGGPGSGSAPQAAAGAKPASIFDRKKDDRSAYLKAQGSSIQKAYGQKY